MRVVECAEQMADRSIMVRYPALASLGFSHFGEDAEECGYTLQEVIEDAACSRSFDTQQAIIAELQVLLGQDDHTLERLSVNLIRLAPTYARPAEPDWGHYPSYRAFWTVVLDYFLAEPAPGSAEYATHAFIRQQGPDTFPDESGAFGRRSGGYVLRRHVGVSSQDIEARFRETGVRAVSVFAAEAEVSGAIHQMLRSASNTLDRWYERAMPGEELTIGQDFPGGLGMIVARDGRPTIPGTYAVLTVRNQALNGMAYFVKTIALVAFEQPPRGGWGRRLSRLFGGDQQG